MASGYPVIDFWRYQLKPLRTLNSRSSAAVCEGALLHVHGGYGCVHPWPSLGDEPIDVQLSLLSQGKFTPLTERALECCAVDGAARAENRDLFRELVVPRSHATLPADESADQLIDRISALHADGFDAVKIKVGPNVAREADRVTVFARHWRKGIRLDFNGSLSPDGMLTFAAELSSETKSMVDFVEDPCPYDEATWQKLQQATGLRLALDRGSERPENRNGFFYRIWKPACSAAPEVHSGERLVVTSYMDHAVGQLFAAYEAARLAGSVELCGLLTHPLFDEDNFFRELRINDARLVVPGGPGLGFGAMLEALPWNRLN